MTGSDERGESRRRFLVTLAAAGTAVAVGGVAAKRSLDRKLARRIAGVLDGSKAAETLGRAWLKENPGQSDARELTRALLADLGSGARFAAAGELKAKIAERVRSDYVEGHVSQVGYWLLSLTELRLCALAALAAEGRQPSGDGAPSPAPSGG